MLRPEEKEHIFAQISQGISLSQISRQLGRSPGTIYKYKRLLASGDPSNQEQAKISSKISPFTETIHLHLKKGERNVKKIFHYLRKKRYRGSYSLLNSYIQNLRASVEQKGYKRSVRVETNPGEQAQVDWGSFGSVRINGRKVKLYAFVYILSYSRSTYVEFVVRQNQQVLQSCHVHAFEKLGIPKSIRYDNMKTVVLSRKRLSNGDQRIYWNPTFQDFAVYYGFQVEACPPYWPRAKGKVEAAVKYLRNNFAEKNLFKKNFSSLEQLNNKVTRWVDDLANQRLHSTTGKKPLQLWKKEKKFLNFPVGDAYNPTPLLHRRSTKDALIQYKSNFYSVPMEYAQKKLFLREIVNHGLPMLEIYSHQECIARHSVSSRRGEWIVDDVHTPKRRLETKNRDQRKQEMSNSSSILVVSRDLGYYNLIN
ncbi:MAG: IS21 family transposase [Candidatus Kerfeldbacteria bacterium]|nr:IS21 family transposase [Candidatus Kerfeldbacteria bacterium]